LAQADAALKNMAGAETEIASAKKLMESSSDKKTRFRVELAEAQVDLESGKNEEAVAKLEKVEKEIGTTGMVALGLEVRLALGKAQMQAGKNLQARTQLDTLSRNAKDKGFLLISEEAAKATRP
jgi:outer membrane protein assembly factor BamD (BamD/ComL family)